MYQLSGQYVAFDRQLFLTSEHGCFEHGKPLQLLIIIEGSSYPAYLLRPSRQIDVAVICILENANIEPAVTAEEMVEPLTRCALLVFDISRDSTNTMPVNPHTRQKTVSQLKDDVSELIRTPDCRTGGILSVDSLDKKPQAGTKPQQFYELARATYVI